MTGDGWKKGSDGIWAKNGKRASFTITTTAGNKRRELTEQIIQPHAEGRRLRHEDQEHERSTTCSSRLGGRQLPDHAALPEPHR